MRSPGSARVAAERVLRAASLGLLAWMVWASLGRGRAGNGERVATPAGLRDSLAAWTADPRAVALRAVLDAPPARTERAWLAALRAAGAAVRWSAAAPAVAIAVEPAGGPGRETRILVAAPRGTRAVITDRVSPLDTLVLDAPAASLRLAAVHGLVRAAMPGSAASASRADSLAPRAVLVLARAGWEPRFVIAALEERGWTVHAELDLAPGVRVRRGAGDARLDTATLAAVIVLDSAGARDAARIARFVRAGGGLVLAGAGARVPALAALAPARAGAREPAVALAFAPPAPRRALPLLPLRALSREAVPLESRDGALAAVAWRVGAGRVLQVGYEDSWQWRMAGDDSASAEFAAWWSNLVSSAAYRPTVPLPALAGADPAPWAATVAALGPPTGAAAGAPATTSPRVLPLWLLVALFAMLLAEWASRRLRGAP